MLTTVVTAILAARPAAAQPIEEVRTKAKVHLGPFYLTPTITLTNVGVDTNVFNDAVDPQSDYTLSVRPAVTVWLPIARRALLETSGAVGFNYYYKFESQRSADSQVAGRFDYYLSRVTLFTTGSYINTRERLNQEVDERARREQDSLMTGVEVRVLQKVYLEGSVGRDRTRFDEGAYYEDTSLRQTLDRDSRLGSLAAKWRLTPLAMFAVRAEAQTDRFLYEHERNSDIGRVMAGFELQPRAIISGKAYVGWQRFRTLDEMLPDETGVIVKAGLSYTLLGVTVFNFTANRNVDYSFEIAEPYYLTRDYGLTVQQHLFGKFLGSIGATRHRYDYRDFVTPREPGQPDAPAEIEARVATTWEYTARVGYGASRGSQIGVAATYFDRESNKKESRGYQGLRVGLYLSYGF